MGLSILTVIGIILAISQVGSVIAASLPQQESSTAIDINEITSQVLPDEGFTTDAVWGTTIHDMVRSGALDPAKLEAILTQQYGQEMRPEWRALLDSDYSNEKISINSENSVFVMLVLWTLGAHDDNPILHDSPLAGYFDDYQGSRAGTSGYGDIDLISLTPEQQQLVKTVTEGSYRPCCGQSAAQPDCSHGFAILGLDEIMGSQGFSKEEMFRANLQFNSFWFPAAYIQNAVYLQVKEGTDWKDADAERMMGREFSTSAGSYNVKKALQDAGL